MPVLTVELVRDEDEDAEVVASEDEGIMAFWREVGMVMVTAGCASVLVLLLADFIVFYGGREEGFSFLRIILNWCRWEV